jgi:hypothetical protein
MQLLTGKAGGAVTFGVGGAVTFGLGGAVTFALGGAAPSVSANMVNSPTQNK